MLIWILKKTSVKKIITLFVLAGFVYGIMITITIPNIREGTGGLEVFDLRPSGYSVELAQEILSSMSEDIKDYYRFVQIPIDFVYPFLMGTLGAFSIAFMRRYVNFPIWLIALPLVAGVCDYLENAFVFLLLGGNTSNVIIHLASISSILKSSITTLYMSTIIFIVIFSIIAVKKRKGR